ncbi:MAG: DEAD/DEAH box helicase [Candidatus Sumerlaeia bacterium]|nr:DEAD/DEAH box helicase [Candidatus Sumerlaeia bacterium]
MNSTSPILSKLRGLGLPESYLASCASRGIASLLPLQDHVLRSHAAVLEGRSALISAPTASGKTLVAEWCMVRQLQRGRQVFYLAPTRALAREKAREFSEVFEPLSQRVALSTGENTTHDAAILRGEIPVVVTVVEKALHLMRHRKLSLSTLRLLVVDEAHLLGEATRGGAVETLLSLWKLLRPRPQLLALSAVLRDTSELARWLDLEVVQGTHRIAPLREGVCNLQTGIFSYRESGSHLHGDEQLLEGTQETPWGRRLWMLTQRPETRRVLVFVSTRLQALEQVRLLLREAREGGFDFRGRDNTPEENVQPNTPWEAFLAELESVGLSLHSADLSSLQRERMEERFKRGQSLVMISTATLEQGVNLLADVVIHDPRMLEDRQSGFGGRQGGVFAPLSPGRFRNQGGRAGRVSEHVGRSVIPAQDAFESEQLWGSIVAAEPEPLNPQLLPTNGLKFLAVLLSLRGALSQSEVLNSLECTFSATRLTPERLASLLDSLLETGRREQLWWLNRDGDCWELTGLGEVFAHHRTPSATLQLWSSYVQKCDPSSPRKSSSVPLLHLLLEDPEFLGHTSFRLPRPSFEQPLEQLLAVYVGDPVGEWILEHHCKTGGMTQMRRQMFRVVAFLAELLQGDEASSASDQLITPGQWEQFVRFLRGQVVAFLDLQERLRPMGFPLSLQLSQLLEQLMIEEPEFAAGKETFPVEQLPENSDEAPKVKDETICTVSVPVPETIPVGCVQLEFDYKRFGRVIFRGKEITLKPLAYRLLVIFAREPGVVIKYDTINLLMWPNDPKFDQQINYHRANLEKALGVAPLSLIRCLPGHGLWLELGAKEIQLDPQVVSELDFPSTESGDGLLRDAG